MGSWYHVFSSLPFSLQLFYTTSQSLIFLCFFYRLHYKPTSRCPENEPASPTKKLFSGQNKTRPRKRRKSSLFFVIHFIFISSGSAGPLIFPRDRGERKRKRAGHDGKGKDYWDTQREPLRTREDLPRGTFLDGYDF